jgi:hypothetical protein
VVSVNPTEMTVSWVSQYSGRYQDNVQIMSPYFHYYNGEGLTCVPEPGAVAVICWPTDGDHPFIVGYLSAPELENAKTADLQAATQNPDVKSSSDLKAPTSTNSKGTTTPQETPGEVTYRGGRPILNPGDILLQGRDENFIILRRGGVLQIGATNICQRVYIPIRNFIRDFCENWETTTAAGTLSWTVKRQENDPAGNAPTEFELLAREFAQDKNASVKVSIGSLDDVKKLDVEGADKVYMNVVVSPQDIDPSSGTWIAGPTVYEFKLDKKGNSWSMQAGAHEVVVEGNERRVVNGKQQITVKGDRTLTLEGAVTESIKKAHSISGDEGSIETWKRVKVISAKAIKLGSEGASEPAVLGLSLVTWLATHTHPPFAPPATPPPVASLLSKKVFVE